jgi:GAF domain-containing protein
MTPEDAESHAELQQRVARLERDLASSAAEVEALSDVGQAVNSTLDLKVVLSTIVERAVAISGSDGGAIYEYDEAAESLVLRAAVKMTDELIQGARRAHPAERGGRRADDARPGAGPGDGRDGSGHVVGGRRFDSDVQQPFPDPGAAGGSAPARGRARRGALRPPLRAPPVR